MDKCYKDTDLYGPHADLFAQPYLPTLIIAMELVITKHL